MSFETLHILLHLLLFIFRYRNQSNKLFILHYNAICSILSALIKKDNFVSVKEKLLLLVQFLKLEFKRIDFIYLLVFTHQIPNSKRDLADTVVAYCDYIMLEKWIKYPRAESENVSFKELISNLQR